MEDHKRRTKGVAFASNSQENKDRDEKDIGESLLDVIDYIGRKFNKSLRRVDRQ